MSNTEAHSQHDEHHGLQHVASKKMLLATITALLVLTILTVMATKIDLGRDMNLLVAMVIATIKAALVAMFFMHLVYDKKLNTVVFLGALLFALLFVAFALMDRGQYLQYIIWDVNAPPTNP